MIKEYNYTSVCVTRENPEVCHTALQRQRQYMLTCKVCRYCLFVLHGSSTIPVIERMRGQRSVVFQTVVHHNTFLKFPNLFILLIDLPR